MKGENIPVIFGLKLRQLREVRGLGLKELSNLARISPSYMTEIEKGKKYPKTDKIMQLAEALGVPYDEMVSLKLGEALNPLESFLDSPIIQVLPLQMFGLNPRDILGLVSRAPKEISALVRTLMEIAGSYNMQVEHFFYAMLRSYQEGHDNYFQEIETAAGDFAKNRQMEGEAPVSLARLRELLTSEMGVKVDPLDLQGFPDLNGFRSIWVQGPPPRLLINPNLDERQQAFQIGREIGYRAMGLGARGITSSRAEVESFEQVMNDFKASYFAGALMIPETMLVKMLSDFFAGKQWDADRFMAIMNHFQVTPEMFLYRLTQLIPRHFGLKTLYFLRINHQLDKNRFRLSKQLNMSGLTIPTENGQNEHFCRRWEGVKLLSELADQQKQGSAKTPLIAAQKARFGGNDDLFFHLTLARPLALTPNTNTSVTLGFRIDNLFRTTVGFWNDPEVPLAEVYESCERCGLEPAECALRAVPPSIFESDRIIENRKIKLDQLLSQMSGN